MIKLFHMPRSRSTRVVWLCEEMGVPYETELVSLREAPPQMAALNPSGTIPVMIDGDVVLTESVTMLEYIAATYGPTPLALQPDEAGYWDYRQLLHYGEATLAGPLNAVVGTTFFGPADQKNNWTVGMVRESFKKRLGVVSKRLTLGDYMVADRFTIADISVAFAINLALTVEMFGLKDLIGPDHCAYRERLAQRPAFQRTFA